MLGKSHVVGSLAVVHVGLLAYSQYVRANPPVADMSDMNRPLGAGSIGTAFGSTLSFPEYLLAVTTVTLFVLLLLRVGRAKVLVMYVGGMVLSLLALALYADKSTGAGIVGMDVTLLLLAFALGALLPDIDSEQSSIGRYIKPISRAIPHRTFTHTLWVVLILVALGWYFKSLLLFALTLGYIFHLVEDSFSKQGINWFYPIGPKFITLSGGGVVMDGRRAKFAYRTGGPGETMFFYASICAHVLCVAFVFWQYLA